MLNIMLGSYKYMFASRKKEKEKVKWSVREEQKKGSFFLFQALIM